jgi:hypothetical protein
MAMIRMQMFFTEEGSGSRGAGWSETHYSFNKVTLTTALADLQTLAEKRVQMLGNQVVCTYLRVSDDEVFNDSQVARGPVPTVVGGVPFYNPAFAPTVPDTAADFAYSVALVRITGDTDFYRRSLYLSGNPDVSQNINNPTPVGAAWLIAFDDWHLTMVNGSYGFKVLQQGPANPRRVITVIVLGVITTQTPHGFVVGDLVKVSRVRGTGNLPNGKWRVATVPDATHFTLQGWDFANFIYDRGGIAQKQVYVLTKDTEVFLRRFGSHRRGRPFDSPVGRRRRRASVR